LFYSPMKGGYPQEGSRPNGMSEITR